MNREEIRAHITEIGIIPAVRLYSAADALFAAEAICEAGIPIVEVTMTVTGAVEVIRELARQNPDIIVGAGTLFDADSARSCLDAGARFLTTTGFDLDIVNLALERHTVVFPGVLTATEVMVASKAGCDFVKIFPCAQVGGPTYIRALKASFPQIPLIASGGVNQQTAADYIRAGAVALGIGADLIHQDAIKQRNSSWIRELARRYTNMVSETRSLANQRLGEVP
jgi:2-dehydro-3-deoxyphosphogluconate aldolase / (4S)-4-hydroxy-2-oxoglutarate aldolase